MLAAMAFSDVHHRPFFSHHGSHQSLINIHKHSALSCMWYIYDAAYSPLSTALMFYAGTMCSPG